MADRAPTANIRLKGYSCKRSNFGNLASSELVVDSTRPDRTFPGKLLSWALRLSEYPSSALCTECLVIALAGCSLSVTANVRAESCRLLVLMGDIAIAVAPGVRASESTCGHRTP